LKETGTGESRQSLVGVLAFDMGLFEKRGFLRGSCFEHNRRAFSTLLGDGFGKLRDTLVFGSIAGICLSAEMRILRLVVAYDSPVWYPNH
jgi:hypothetical protein